MDGVWKRWIIPVFATGVAATEDWSVQEFPFSSKLWKIEECSETTQEGNAKTKDHTFSTFQISQSMHAGRKC